MNSTHTSLQSFLTQSDHLSAESSFYAITLSQRLLLNQCFAAWRAYTHASKGARKVQKLRKKLAFRIKQIVWWGLVQNVKRSKAKSLLECKKKERVFRMWRGKFVRNLHFRVAYHGIERRQHLKNAFNCFKEHSEAEKRADLMMQKVQQAISAGIKKAVFSRFKRFVELRAAKRDNAFKVYFFQE